MHKNLARGQVATDYLLALSVILIIVVGVAIPLFNEFETSLAIGAARVGAGKHAASLQATLTSIEYSTSPTNVSITPIVFLDGVRLSTPQLRAATVAAIAAVFNPSANASCVRAIYNTYCVE